MKEMKKDKEWYLAWQPGNAAYARDDIIVAVGLKTSHEILYLRDIISWLGVPDKANGNAEAGSIVYYFKSQQETAAHFDIVEKQVMNFGTITRNRDNAATSDGKPFNLLDVMEEYNGSEMKRNIEPGGGHVR